MKATFERRVSTGPSDRIEKNTTFGAEIQGYLLYSPQLGSNIKPFTKKQKMLIRKSKIASELWQTVSATY